MKINPMRILKVVARTGLLAVILVLAGPDLRAHGQVPPRGDAENDARAATQLATQFSAAYQARDAARLRSLLVENYQRLKKSEPARVKAEFSHLMQLGREVDLAGPALTNLLALQDRGELSPTVRAGLDKALARLAEATLNPRSELARLLAQQRFLEELASGRPVSQERWLENLACDSEESTPDAITLRDGLVLAARREGDLVALELCCPDHQRLVVDLRIVQARAAAAN